MSNEEKHGKNFSVLEIIIFLMNSNNLIKNKMYSKMLELDIFVKKMGILIFNIVVKKIIHTNLI